MPPIRRRIAVIGCRDRGGLAIALAIANPQDVVAAFDADSATVAAARRAAARHHVADRVTFELAAPHRLPGTGYDVVILCRGGSVGRAHPPLPTMGAMSDAAAHATLGNGVTLSYAAQGDPSGPRLCCFRVPRTP